MLNPTSINTSYITSINTVIENSISKFKCICIESDDIILHSNHYVSTLLDVIENYDKSFIITVIFEDEEVIFKKTLNNEEV